MRLLVVRHGETEQNAVGIIQGQLPGVLTEKGINQAKTVAKELADETFEAMYTSDLQRCLDTAAHIGVLHQGTPLIASPHLREQAYGSYEGTRAEDIDWSTVEGDFYNRQPGGGESMLQLQTRVMEFVDKILSLHQTGDVLLVTHTEPMRVIKANLERLPLEEVASVPVENCAIWEFDL